MDTSQMEDFTNWLESDNVIRTSDDGYRTQCTLYKKEFTYSEVMKYFLKEYGTN